ncbi:hypothetical protein M407DRAFT_26084 [Tulasnella calospora MUT 4182]|uniref:Uncharacterized protein n=1 Tax=Tulasnella calospora MUT 4182 TaxID=1051891 RepID=A0A0C3QEZ1_9AGAM|nr:hypothetical protein M407DRAFT_26084 [Tulasnella calospora MUT 4182]
MDSLIPLFILVGPMHEGTDGEWDFSEPIQRADCQWSRYAIYASRIRNISLIDMFFGKGVSNQAFQAIMDHIPAPSRVASTSVHPDGYNFNHGGNTTGSPNDLPIVAGS